MEKLEMMYEGKAKKVYATIQRTMLLFTIKTMLQLLTEKKRADNR